MASLGVRYAVLVMALACLLVVCGGCSTGTARKPAAPNHCSVIFNEPMIAVHLYANREVVAKSMQLEGLRLKPNSEYHGAVIELSGTGTFRWSDHQVVVKKDGAVVDGVSVAPPEIKGAMRNVIAGKEVQVDAFFPFESIVHRSPANPVELVQPGSPLQKIVGTQECMVFFPEPMIAVFFYGDPKEIKKFMKVEGLRQEPDERPFGDIDLYGTGTFQWQSHKVVVKEDGIVVDGVAVAPKEDGIRDVTVGEKVLVDEVLPVENRP